MTWQILAVIPLFWQLAVALWAHRSQRLLKRIGYVELHSGYNGAELLEKYTRMHPGLSIKVDAPINPIAEARGESVLINRRLVYSKDVGSLVEIILQLMLSTKKYQSFQSSRLYSLLFLIQVGFAIAVFATSDILVAIGLLLLFIITFFGARDHYLASQKLYTECLNSSIDLLNLNFPEQELAKQILRLKRRKFYTYPLVIITTPLRFLVP